MNVKEEDLIEYIKPLLKAQGFKKKQSDGQKLRIISHIYSSFREAAMIKRVIMFAPES